MKSNWSTIQLYSTVNSVHSDEKCLITVNVQEGCYFFVFFLHILIYLICLKCPPLAQIRLMTHECHWLMDVSMCVVQRCANVYLHN